MDSDGEDCFLIKSFMSQENYFQNLGNSKLLRIKNEIEKSDEAFRISKQNINQLFDDICKQWKHRFLQELDEAVVQQHTALRNEELELKKYANMLNKVFSEAKGDMRISEKKVSRCYLKKIMPLVHFFCNDEQDAEFFPVKFVACEDRHQLGFIQQCSIDINSLKLETYDKNHINAHVMYYVKVPAENHVDQLSEYFSWKVEVEGEEITTTSFTSGHDFQIEFFVSKMKLHTITFRIFNQHIIGSPTKFMPVSPQAADGDVFKERIDRKSNFKPDLSSDLSFEPTNEAVQPINLLLPKTAYPARTKESFFQDPLSRLPEAVSLMTFSPISVNTPSISIVNKNQIMIPPAVKLVNRSVRVRDSAMPLRKPKILNNVPFGSNANMEIDYEENTNDPSSSRMNLEKYFEKLNVHDSNIAEYPTVKTEQDFNAGLKTMILNNVIIKDERRENSDNEGSHASSDILGFNNAFIRKAPHDWSLEDNEFKSTLVEETSKVKCKEENPGGSESLISLICDNIIAEHQSYFTGDWRMQLCNPIGVAALMSKEIVVANTFANCMVLFSDKCTYLRSFNAKVTMTRPSAIVVLSDGRFAVKDDYCINTFSEQCQWITCIGSGILKRPYGIAADKKCNLITIDTGFSHSSLVIVRFNFLTGELLEQITVQNALPRSPNNTSKPRFIAFRPPNTLYVVDLGLHEIYIVDMNTGLIMKKFGGKGKDEGMFFDPSGIVCDKEGFLMIGDSKNHRIQLFTPEGDFLTVLPVDRSLRRPSGLCLTSDGFLLVLNYWEDSVVKYKLCSK